MRKNRAFLIIKNTLSNYLRHIVEILVFLVLTPFIVSKLGTKAFGLWSLIMATVGLLRLLDMGVAGSVVKYIADARGRGEMDRKRNLCATFFWVYVAIGSCMIAISLILLPFLTHLLKIPQEYAQSARIVFFVVTLRTALSMPLGAFTGILIGHQKQSWVNTLKTLGVVTYLLAALWILNFYPSLESLVWIHFATGIVPYLIAMLICMWKIEDISISPHYFSKDLLKEISTFSLYLFIIHLSTVIYMRVDALIIQAYISLSAVALYTVASRISEKASGFCRQLTNALTPIVAELKGAGEEENIRAVLQKGSKISIAVATPLLIGLFWFAEDLLVVWVGESFRPAGAVCRILLAAMMISVIHATAANVLSMTGFQKFVAYSFVAGQILNLILTLILAYFYKIIGVAAATLISTACIDIGLIRRKIAKEYHFSFIQFYYKTLYPSIPGCIIMLALLYSICKYIPPTSLIQIALLEILACIAFSIGFLIFGLSSKERNYYKERLGKFLKLSKK